MAKFMNLKINNSKNASIKSGKWRDPGAKLYDQLSSAVYIASNICNDPRNKSSEDILKEAYLVAPVNNIKHGVHGENLTPYSKSGFKYPHHVIKDKELVVHEIGLKAAYARAKQMGVFRGEIKEHLERHYKQLGLYEGSTMEIDESIENNFDYVKNYISESFNVDTDISDNLLISTIKEATEDINNLILEASHGKLKYDFRMGWDYNTGHQIKVVYSLNDINITGVGDFYWKHNRDNRNPDGSLKMSEEEYKKYVKNHIRRRGNNDHQSRGQKVLAIIDNVTNKRLQSVKLINPFCKFVNTRNIAQTENDLKKIRIEANKNPSKFINELKVGEVDNGSTFKATKWFSRVTDEETGENLRFNKIAKSEIEKHGRGAKIDNINAKDFEIFNDDTKYMTYHNPNKKQALQELYMRERDCINFMDRLKEIIYNKESIGKYSEEDIKQMYLHNSRKLRAIQKDIDTIQQGYYNLSMMKKYREAAQNYQIYEYNNRLKQNENYLEDMILPYKSVNYYEMTTEFDDLYLEEFENIPYVLEQYSSEKESNYPLNKKDIADVKLVDEFIKLNKNNSLNESYIFNENNLEVDLDKWKIDVTNILFITGQSGSGKTTLGKQLAKENNALLVSVDFIECETPDKIDEWLKDGYDKKYKECECLPYIIRFYESFPHIKDNYNELFENELKFNEVLIIFIRWIIEEVKNLDRLVIIEGTQMAFNIPYKEYENYPLIITGTSMLMSTFQRIKRSNNNYGYKVAIKNLLLFFRKYKMWIDDERTLNKLKDHIRGSRDLILEYVDDGLGWIESHIVEDNCDKLNKTEYLIEDVSDNPPSLDTNSEEENKSVPEDKVEKESMPKKVDKVESDKNGVRRKKLYIAFIEWAKAYNPKNTFGSVFDKDAFNVTYPFVPHEMRYFYRLANPMLCVLAGNLTFFAVAELKKLNIKNSRLSEMMIFAATDTDMRVFNIKDKKVYRGIEENGMLKLAEVLGDNFDTYIQKMINQGDILNAPLEERVDIIVSFGDSERG